MVLGISQGGPTQERRIFKTEGIECPKLVTEVMEELRSQQGPERQPGPV